MTAEQLENVNIVSRTLLPTPEEVHNELPLSSTAMETVVRGRKTVEDILSGKDHRVFVVLGPCSIHDEEAAIDYAKRLKALSDEVSDTLCLVMRVYFEKPRTRVGWKGFINDPDLDDSFKIEEGLRRGRKLLLEINELGVPTGTEALDPISPQYMSDLFSWTAIGARTTESQTHRELASGLSSPVGFKNGTDGSVTVAINALHSAAAKHHFLGLTKDGRAAVFHTKGNRFGHIILRGGEEPNYDSVHVAQVEKSLDQAKLPQNIMVDCSHGNSKKDYKLQPLVLRNCVDQIKNGNRSIVGFMLESNINEGNQSIPENLSELKYGVSVTDSCMNWEVT